MVLEDRLNPMLYQFLSTAIEIVGANKGNIQFLEKTGVSLRLAAHIGFSDDFLSLFQVVKPGDATPCNLALQRRCRVVVKDLLNDPLLSSNAVVTEYSSACVMPC